jgi:hypothetical protein
VLFSDIVTIDPDTLFSHCSSHHGKVEANSSLAEVPKIPSQLFGKQSWDSKKPASSNFTLGKRKKTAGARYGD